LLNDKVTELIVSAAPVLFAAVKEAFTCCPGAPVRRPPGALKSVTGATIVGVEVGIIVGVAVGATVVTVGVPDGVGVLVTIEVAVGTGVKVGVCVGSDVGVAVGGPTVLVAVGLAVGVAVAFGVKVGMKVGGPVTLNSWVAVADISVELPAKFAVCEVSWAKAGVTEHEALPLVSVMPEHEAPSNEIWTLTPVTGAAGVTETSANEATSVIGLPAITVVGLRLNVRKVVCGPSVQVITD